MTRDRSSRQKRGIGGLHHNSMLHRCRCRRRRRSRYYHESLSLLLMVQLLLLLLGSFSFVSAGLMIRRNRNVKDEDKSDQKQQQQQQDQTTVASEHVIDVEEYDVNDERTLLDTFGEYAKEYLTQKVIPTTDVECKWDWRFVRCEPYCECDYLPKRGDYHIGRSCRRSEDKIATIQDCNPYESIPQENTIQLMIQKIVFQSQSIVEKISKVIKKHYNTIQDKVCTELPDKVPCYSSSTSDNDNDEDGGPSNRSSSNISSNNNDVILAWQERLLCRHLIPDCFYEELEQERQQQQQLQQQQQQQTQQEEAVPSSSNDNDEGENNNNNPTGEF